jgi:microcompartment protein CcmK/EutM
MIVARVRGNVISTNKSERMQGMKMLIVVEVDIPTQQEKSHPLVAIDTVGAGEGELVLCVSGSSSRQTQLTDQKPVDLAIVGIIDSMEMHGKRVFAKYGTEKQTEKQADKKKPTPSPTPKRTEKNSKK